MLINNTLIQSTIKHANLGSLTPLQKDALALSQEGKHAIITVPTDEELLIGLLLPLYLGLNKNLSGIQAMMVLPYEDLVLKAKSIFDSFGEDMPYAFLHPEREEKAEAKELKDAALIFGTPDKIAHHLAKEHFSVSRVNALSIVNYDKILELKEQVNLAKSINQIGQIESRIVTVEEKTPIPKFLKLVIPQELDYSATPA